MKLVAGLGNPGPRYHGTRHNAGFMTVDRLASQLGVAFNREKHQALLAEARVGGEKVLLAKPLTFMNRSGAAVAPLIRNTPEGPSGLLVVTDDTELPPGRLRMRAKGSSGGHNGLKSIIAHVGTQEFARLRIGVGKGDGGAMTGHVLGRFTPEEKPVFEEAVERAANAVLLFLEEGLERAMAMANQAAP